jgi:putative membrane protein
MYRADALTQPVKDIDMRRLYKAMTAGIFLFMAATSFSQAAKLDDAQIAGVVVAANTVDIEAGKLAESKASNEEVKAFGKQMVKDHTAVNEQAGKLVKKLNVNPVESDLSKTLNESGTKMLKKMKGLKGKEFDKAYIDNEVTYHQTVLDTLDKTLIPDAKNKELKELLEKTRPAFVEHLDHAKHLQASMK